MAKLYGNIASSALMTFDKSFARANGQPLDSTEVYYSLADAQEYAAGAGAYIGQKIVVIEEGVVTHYSIEDAAGTLKELGSKPVGDGTTISIAEDGKISLANITDKAEGTYNAVLINGVLSWVKPSETTVEGLSDLIQALTGRVDGHDTAIAANKKAIEDEAAAARAAEKALGERIDAIDFVDDDEMAEAIAAAREEISTEIDEDVKVAKDRADEVYTLASGKVDADAYATDKAALEAEDAAIRAIAEDAQTKIDLFLESEDIDETVNTLKEIQAELDKMTDATELATALSSKADTFYVNEELAKKQDVIAEGTYDAFGAAEAAKEAAIADAEGKIATAKQEAIDAAAEAAEAIYATKDAVTNLETAMDERLDVLEAINHELYATKAELEAHDTAANAKYASKDELAPVKQTADNAAAKVETLEDKIEEITSVGGEPNVIDYIKVNGTILEVEKDAEGKSTKTVNVIVPTKASDLTDDTGFDARITAAQSKAEEGVNAAAAAQNAANQAQSEVDAVELVVNGIQTTVAGHGSTIADHTTRIAELEAADIAHAAEYKALDDIVKGHTEAIAKKADALTVESVSAKASANETAIQTLNTVTIPGIEAEIAKKADASVLNNYHTKTEIANIIGTVEEGKTLADMIAGAQEAATYDDTEIRQLITDEVTRADAAEKANAKEIARVNNVLVAALENDEEGLDSIKELATWINEHGVAAEEMVTAIGNNTDAIAAINHETTGILAQAKGYTDAQISALPVATAEVLGLVKFDNNTVKMNASNQLYVAKVSTDILEQGEQTLILNGGSASM